MLRRGLGGARRTSPVRGRDYSHPSREVPHGRQRIRRHLTETGEKVLKGAITFSDPAIAAKANAGELSLSTGLASPEAPDPRLPGATRIAGPVTPNHVLVFDRGACPNCYPNDSGAMFHNLQEPDMPDDETKGLLKRIADALTKTPEPPQQHNNLAEIEGLKKDLAAANAKIAEMANLIKPPEQKGDKPDEEKENLKKELADLKAAQAKKDADAKWSAVKVNLPKGWAWREKKRRPANLSRLIRPRSSRSSRSSRTRSRARRPPKDPAPRRARPRTATRRSSGTSLTSSRKKYGGPVCVR